MTFRIPSLEEAKEIQDKLDVGVYYVRAQRIVNILGLNEVTLVEISSYPVVIRCTCQHRTIFQANLEDCHEEIISIVNSFKIKDGGLIYIDLTVRPSMETVPLLIEEKNNGDNSR